MVIQAPSQPMLPFPGHRTLGEVRVCKTCGAELIKRRGDTRARFATRIFCSTACRHADQKHSSKARINKVLAMVEHGLSRTEICAAMGLKMWGLIELVRRHGVKLPRSPRMSPARPAPRVCEVCSNSFERGPQEKLHRLWNRRFCSKKCRSVGHSKWLLARARRDAPKHSDKRQAVIDELKRRTFAAREAHLAKRNPPKPGTVFETVEEAVARGVPIIKCPPMHVAPPWSMVHPRTVEGGRVSAGRP